MSSPDTIALARRIIHFLCVGACIDGMRFGPNYQLLITPDERHPDSPYGQVYLNLSDCWWLVPESLWSGAEEGEPTPCPEGEKLQRLSDLQNRRIEAFDLAEGTHRLALFLEGGWVLALHGSDPSGVCWDLGLAFRGDAEEWEVVTKPDGTLDVECPESFLTRRGGRLTVQ